MDANGIVIGRNVGIHVLRPDKSTVLIEDDFGETVLRARYLNPQAFQVDGSIPYRGRIIPLLPVLHGMCTVEGVGPSDIRID